MTSLWQMQRFDSIEVLQSGLEHSDVEPVQVKPEAFVGTSVVARLGPAQLRARSFRGAARVRGVLSNRAHCLAVLLDVGGKSSQWSFETRSGDIAVVPAGADHEACYDDKTSFVVLEVSEEALVEQTTGLAQELPETIWDNPLMHRPANPLGQLIASRFRTAVNEIFERPQLLNNQNATQALYDELSGVMLQGCASSQDRPIRRRQAFISSSRLVRDVENYLTEHPDNPVRASDLCAHLNVSTRTLHRAFQDVFDESPGAYMRRWRLSRVRCRLSNPELADQRVSEVAFSFGFWELGRFAGQYRKHFGELPSETLIRAAAG